MLTFKKMVGRLAQFCAGDIRALEEQIKSHARRAASESPINSTAEPGNVL